MARGPSSRHLLKTALMGLAERPSEPVLRAMGEAWQPWRSVAACLFWQSYLHARGRAAPILPSELYASEG